MYTTKKQIYLLFKSQALQRPAKDRLIGFGQRNCGVRLACGLNGDMNLRLEDALGNDVDTKACLA